MRSSRSTWLSAALSLLVAGAALAQKIPPAELAALSHVQSAFFTGADSGVMALQVTVAPELQRSLGLPPRAHGAQVYEALLGIIGGRKFDSRRMTAAEIAGYGARAGFEPVAQLPIIVEADELRVLVQYDMRATTISFVGQLAQGDAAAEPAAQKPKPKAKARPKPRP